MNKYHINDKLFYYDSNKNKILIIIVFAITFSEKDDIECKYNYLYPESKLYSTYEECFKAARETIKELMNHLVDEIKMQLNEYYEIPNNEEGGI